MKLRSFYTVRKVARGALCASSYPSPLPYRIPINPTVPSFYRNPPTVHHEPQRWRRSSLSASSPPPTVSYYLPYPHSTVSPTVSPNTVLPYPSYRNPLTSWAVARASLFSSRSDRASASTVFAFSNHSWNEPDPATKKHWLRLSVQYRFGYGSSLRY